MLWSNERIESSAKVAWREGTYCSIDILMRMMRDEYESRIAELEADHAAALDKWMDAIADLQASLRKTRERNAELEAELLKASTASAEYLKCLDTQQRDFYSEIRKRDARIIELEAQLSHIVATDNGTLPEDPRDTMWRDDAIAILALHGWQTPQRLSNGEIEHIMHTDARNFDEYRAAIYGAPVKYRWLDDWCMWVDEDGDPVLEKDKGAK